MDFLEDEKENLPKLIIIDMNSPVINGTSGMKKLLEIFDVKVIMYTAHCTDKLVKDVKALGGLDCVKKERAMPIILNSQN